MAKENETIADIIAWLRKPREGENAYLTLWRDEISDRIEAALKRERGDRAKLREALSKSCAYFAVVLNTGMFNRVHLEALLNMANAALAAPARNCDEYANHNDAMQAFDAFVRGQGKLGFINPYTEAFKWLFAPATEKEGGNDAD